EARDPRRGHLAECGDEAGGEARAPRTPLPPQSARRPAQGRVVIAFRTRYDAVIVGGGHNGLVAATYLARAGQSVLLLERNAELGGATASKALFPGVDARLPRYSYLVSLLAPSIVRDLDLRFSTRQRAIAS